MPGSEESGSGSSAIFGWGICRFPASPFYRNKPTAALFLKASANDFAGFGDHNKDMGSVLLNKAPELYGLRAAQRREDDILIPAGKSALCMAHRCFPVEFPVDKIADGPGIVPNNVKVLTQVKVFDDAVDYKGFRSQKTPGTKVPGE